MIDYLALALGHGLMAIALLRLVLREDIDADPLLARLKKDTAENRMAASAAGRNAARRARGAAAERDAEDARVPAAERQRDGPGAHVADAQHSRRLNR